ncbi:tRNA(Met) cytidine acetyltransferase [Candidatus Photodesmus blepharus]|uniref:tRNA(Met) cytidine acetyltransferase n=1 Tax=Candidatus Photodesmus blepharonis TaxID=1179155 RepID=A0A084CPC7_9GAMM|nr:GNAT family N-acetyltransferase [Candidatus Photodesmus blepharus]KEY91656.1 tRNA(Met) cytidine acetyltransferase [Candidatus Photodesmus blepharus]
MIKLNNYLSDLKIQASFLMHRFGLVLRGDRLWSISCVEIAIKCYKQATVFQLGGEPFLQAYYANFNKGQELLGRECQVLVCDFSQGFDANSFNSVLGTLVGGGLLFILPGVLMSNTADAIWLRQSLNKLITLSQGSPLPALPHITSKVAVVFSPYKEQSAAVDKIVHLIKSRKKCPFVLTANRGRGKSSALGIAAAQLMHSQTVRIVVTAPSVHAVESVFRHACRKLKGSQKTKYVLSHQDSLLSFIAPDKLLCGNIKCDLLIVDEAAAIPIPMLKNMVECYHRIVFASTVHGYEGSGRGFALKFVTWLRENRSGTDHLHLDRPIRWQRDDQLEKWQYQTFLLNLAEPIISPSKTFRLDLLHLYKLDKSMLVRQLKRLEDCFALLFYCHYQISPNDFFLLLKDNSFHIYVMLFKDECIGCMVVVEEGGLKPSTVKKIQEGGSRLKGQLVPSVIVKNMGIVEAAYSISLRIMRIVVHPKYRRLGVGSKMIDMLDEQIDDVDYISTSFGATQEFVDFWLANKFFPISIGSKRDQASGCHSLIMIKSNSLAWLEKAQVFFKQNLDYLLSCTLKTLEPEIVRILLSTTTSSSLSPTRYLKLNALIDIYIKGGSNFDAVAFQIKKLINSLSARDFIHVSCLVLAKVIQQKSWKECVEQFHLSGWKQCEFQLKKELNQLLTYLWCKMN